LKEKKKMTNRTNECKQEQAKLREEYRAIQAKRWNNDEKMVNYCTDRVARFVRLRSGHILTIDKPRIETRFCFGYSDSRYDEDYDRANNMARYASTSEEYFKTENLKQLQGTIDALNGIGRFGYSVAYISYGNDGEATLNFCSSYELIEKRREEINEQDREAIMTAYKLEIAAFEKRLNTYLKRYGLSKVHTWSYWRDA
jgi:hypothetical protein